MSELISLKRSKKKQDETKNMPVSASGDEYGWGTRLGLDDPEIKALGIDVSKLSVDDVLSISCKGKVVSISQSASKEQNSRSVQIQITDMAINGTTAGKKSSKAFSAFNKLKNGNPEE